MQLARTGPSLFHSLHLSSMSNLTGELKKIKALVVDAKEKSIKVVPTLVNRMLEKNVFLFGSVDLNAGSFSQTVNQLTELQNARVQLAYKKCASVTYIYIHPFLNIFFMISTTSASYYCCIAFILTGYLLILALNSSLTWTW